MGERSGAPSFFSPPSIVISKPPVAVQLPQPDVSANRDPPQTLAAIVFAVVFVGGAIGLELQRALPESYTTGGAKDMTGAVVGLMTLLLALVLGLLIWTAFGVFSTQKASVQTLAITNLKLDEAFQDYGPEAAEGHRILREGIKNTIAEIWGDRDADEEAVIHKFGYARAYLKARIAYLNTLQPASDQQTAAKAEAMQAAIAIGQLRTQMTLALVDPISYSLISIVVAWAAFLFCGYGLLSKRHPMSYVVLVVGALGIASAIYIIADLISPYSGVFVVSPEPLVDVLNAVEAAAAPAGAHR